MTHTMKDTMGLECTALGGHGRGILLHLVNGGSSSASHMMEEEFWLFGSKWSRWT